MPSYNSKNDLSKQIDDLWEMIWLLRAGQSGGGGSTIVPWTVDIVQCRVQS